MTIERLEGRSPVLGRVRVRLPVGLVAVVGRDGRTGGAFVRLLRRALQGLTGDEGPETARVVVRGSAADAGAPVEDLTALRLGGGRGEDPGEVLDVSARALARVLGAARLDDAVARVVASSEHEEAVALLAHADPTVLRARVEELEGTPDRVPVLERELREHRADHAEVAGDLEVATMEWLRERQDAETHLHAYRDRARELKVRLTQLENAGPDAPCPTCGRVLERHYDEVVVELREEWESVVQDGSWWKRRRDQLELKPDALRELEGRSLRLQAATEALAERLERVRARDRELRTARERLRSLERVGSGEAARPARGVGEDPAPALLRAMTNLKEEMVGEARERILEAARRIVLEISGGRLLGMTRRPGGGVELEGVAARLTDPTPEDRAVAVVAIRLGAAAALLEEDPAWPGTLVVSPPFDRMDEESRLRAVQYLLGLRERIPQILLVTRGPIVELCPEPFDAVLELGAEGEGEGPSIRALPAGVGSLRIG